MVRASSLAPTSIVKSVYYYGQLLASITNIKANYSLPLQFEPIERSDIETEYSKNDCELNAKIQS